MQQLATVINEAWDHRADIKPQNVRAEVRDAVNEFNEGKFPLADDANVERQW